MVVVSVICSQSVHDRQLQFRQSLRQDDIPDLFRTGMRFISGIIHAGMAVINFKEVLTDHFHQVFRCDSVMKVRVV